MITLTFASSQAIHGMEDFSKPGEQGVQKPYALRVSSGYDIAEEGPQQKKEIRENPFQPKKCSVEIRFKILERAAIDHYFRYGNTGSLGLVCQDWHHIVEQDEMKKSIESINKQEKAVIWSSGIDKTIQHVKDLQNYQLTYGELVKVLEAMKAFYGIIAT